MKIAIILFGLLRTWSYTRRSFEASTKHFSQVDYYIDAWDTMFANTESEKTAADMFSGLSVKYISLADSQKDYSDNRLYSLQKMLRAFQQLSERYDAILISRPDLFLVEKLFIPKDNTLYTNACVGGGFPPDWCMYGTHNVIEALTSLVDKFPDLSGHQFMKASIEQLSIQNIVTIHNIFVFCIRHNAHHQSFSCGVLVIDSLDKIVIGNPLPWAPIGETDPYWVYRSDQDNPLFKK